MTAPPDRLVVAGAGLAGLCAVEGARAGGFEGSITLIGAEDRPPYDRPPLSKAFLEPGLVPPAVTTFRAAEQLADDLGVTYLRGRRAVALRFASRHVLLDSGEALSYDRLIVATGAHPLRIDGDEPTGVVTLRTPVGAQRVREALERGARIVVVGASVIGSEIASAARSRGLPVTMVFEEPVPMGRTFGLAAGHVCALLHERAGVELRAGNRVVSLATRAGRVTGVVLSEGGTIDADLVVVELGTAPSTAWLEGSGLMLHPRDRGVVCGPDLRTSLPDVWACGDVAHAPWASIDGDLLRVEQWRSAVEQGFVAGRNAIGRGLVTTFTGTPTRTSGWHGHRIRFSGSPHYDETVSIGAPGSGHVILYRRDETLGGVFSVDDVPNETDLHDLVGHPASWSKAMSSVGEGAPLPVSGDL